MKKLLLFAGLLAIGFSACKDEEDPPQPPPPAEPKACFGVSKDFVDSGEAITFTNCSENATGYQWNFGTGAPVTDKVPAPRAFTKSGTYPITLIVYNQDASLNDDTTISITVARRSLTKFVVNKFKALTKDADGSDPDLKFMFGPSSNPQQYETAVKVNALGSFELSIDPNIVFTDANKSNWIFRLMRSENGGLTPVRTFGGGANPLYPSRAAASPFKIVNDADYDIELHYELIK